MNTEFKQIDNNKEEKPFEFYLEKYQNLDPKEAAERCNIPYDEDTKEFLVRLMGYEYGISFPEFTISPKTEPGCLSDFDGKYSIQNICNEIFTRRQSRNEHRKLYYIP